MLVVWFYFNRPWIALSSSGTSQLGTDHLTWRGGGGLLFFVSFRIFFRITRELEYLFFLWRKARKIFPEFNIRFYDKNSESDYFSFLHQNQNIFFSNIGNQNIFLEKNHTPPPPLFKLNGRSLMHVWHTGDDKK
jgi:hypothetical protein